MTLRAQQLFAGIAFGGAMATAFAIAVPQLAAGETAPAIVAITAAPEAVPVEVANPDDATVDMNHWQETGGHAPSPYIPGKTRKKK